MYAHPGSVAPLAAELTVCDLIDRQAAHVPDKTAVVEGPEHTTYAVLAAAANDRAAWLAARGVMPGTRVGIGMERSTEMVLWVLAILKAGAAYVPLDPQYPTDRLRFVVEDAGLQLAVVDSLDGAWAAGLPLDLICARSAGAAAEQLSLSPTSSSPGTPFVNGATPDRTAYVIYTSGSTGTPKGVEIGHAALAHFVSIVPLALGIQEDDVWLLTASISYAVQVRQLLTPLTVGATIAVADAGDMRDPLRLMETIKCCGATLLDLVPSHWRACNRLLAALPLLERARLLDNRLRQIVSVGEPLTYDLPRTWRHSFGHGARIVNILGQTETTGMFTSYTLPPNLEHSEGVVPVGLPLPGVELHLLDGKGRPVAEGEAGEIYLSTPCLANGYLNRPQLTSQRFLPHPSGLQPGGRIYRTGDLGRRRQDGNLQYLGRSDQQVKVRGKRVDLIEVENYLRHSARVQDAGVIAIQNSQTETEIVGYVAADPEAALSLRAIWADLRLHLPEHALPSQVFRMDVLPYLPNGKLDRQGLAAGLPQEGTARGEAVPLGAAPACRASGDILSAVSETPPPSAAATLCACRLAQETMAAQVGPGSVQSLVQAAWAAVLGHEPLCRDDDFFMAGGTSLQAALLAARLGQALATRVPVELIYRAPTVATLTLALNRLLIDGAGAVAPAAATSPLVLLRAGDEFPPFFLVHGLGGGVVGYADLVQRLPPGCPIYGLQAAGHDGETTPDTTIEAMAARYRQAIHSVQRSGPYRLGGYCYGGIVAFELARQLAAAGGTPQLVAIIEGYAPGWRRRHTVHWRSLLSPQRLRLAACHMPFWWQEYRRLGPDVLRRRIVGKLQSPGRTTGEGGKTALGSAQGLVDDDLSLLPAYRQQLLDAHLQALRCYTPAPYGGDIVLFRGRDLTVSQVMTEPLEANLGWCQLAGGVTLHRVNGAHRNLHLMPYAASLAAALAPYLVPVN